MVIAERLERLAATDLPVAGLSLAHRRAQHYPADFTIQPDAGCELAPSCLRCPLPRCKYDDPAAARVWARTPRNRRVLEAFEAGAEIDALAARFGISRRSVYRAIAEARHTAVRAPLHDAG